MLLSLASSSNLTSFMETDAKTKDFATLAAQGETEAHQSSVEKALSKMMLSASKFITSSAEVSISLSSIIYSLFISNDNELVYLATERGNITCFNLKEGKIANDVCLGIGALYDIIIDEDNNRLIVCGETEIIRSYKLPLFQLDLELLGHTGFVNKLCYDLSKEKFYSAGFDGTIRVWNLINLQEKKILFTHEGKINDLVIAEDNSFIASAGEDGIIKIFNLSTETEIVQLNESLVTCLAVCSSLNVLASGSSDGRISIWYTVDWTLLKSKGIHTGATTALRLCETKPVIITGGEDSFVKIWNFEKETTEQLMKGHTDSIKNIKISPDMSFFASTSIDTTAHIWRFPDEFEDFVLKDGSNCEYTSAAFIPNSTNIVSCGTDRIVKYWDESGSSLPLINTLGNGLKISVSPNKKYIAVGDELGTLYIIDGLTLQELNRIEAHNGLIRDLCFSPDSTRLITGGGDSLISIWSLPSMNKLQCKGHCQSIWSVCVSNTGRKVYSGSSDQTIRIWNCFTAKQLGWFNAKEPINVMAIDKKDKLLIIGGMIGDVSVWNIEECSEESNFHVHTGLVTGIVLMNNNDLFMTAGKDKKINIISLKYRIRISYMDHKQPINSLVMSLDETYIATGEKCYISAEENPLTAKETRLIGPSEFHQPFLAYLRDILFDQNPEHIPMMDQFVIVPQLVNPLHFYVYLNLKEYVAQSLCYNIPIIRSKAGFHPFYIALLKDYKAIRDEIVDSICLNAQLNPFWLQMMEDEIIKMNVVGFPKLADIYEVIYQEVKRKSFPRFCESNVVLPICFLSNEFRAKVSDFFEDEDISTQGISICFKETCIPFNFSMGSKESIDFLSSISECENKEIFRTQIILDIAHYKWETAKIPMTIQGCIFYVYLIMLSLYTSLFAKDPTFLMIVFIMNILLMFYEIYQMVVSGKSYFKFVWNYVDWARTILLLAYNIIEWSQDYFRVTNNMVLLIKADGEDATSFHLFGFANSLFALVTFISWARGVSYFRLFDSTRYFINLLIHCFASMGGFLVMMTFMAIGFCFLFVVIVKDPSGNVDFMNNLRISYWLILGSTEAESYGFIEMGVLTFGIMINPIIMMTILVAKVTDEYEQIQSDSITSDTKELIDMAIEVENMMFWKRKTGSKQYFQSVKETAKDEDMSWEGRLAALNKMIEKSSLGTQEFYENLIKKLSEREILVTKNREKAEKVADICDKIIRVREERIAKEIAEKEGNDIEEVENKEG